MCRLSRVTLCAIALLAMVGTPLQGGTKPEDIYRKALPSVMMLEVENHKGERFVGSAVLALGDDIAVTAWHVVCDARQVWATFSDGQRVAVTGCIDKDPGRDLAAIRLEKRFPKRKATLSLELQPVAARAYVIGAPKGYGFSISDGLISQVRRVDGFSQYQVSCPISLGNSGGPVLNERGEVIGIASWTKADAQNVSFAIPARELTRLEVKRPAVPWSDLSKSAGLSPARGSEASSLAARGTNGNGNGGLAELKARLEQSKGKPVTVILRENGQEEKYSFTVPAKGLK